MSATDGARRAMCRQCLRAQTTCICRWIRLLTPACELLILQHPLETFHAKGSARLLHLSLGGSRLETGESFADAQLFSLLHEPWQHSKDFRSESAPRSVLLYPATPQQLPARYSCALTPDGARAELATRAPIIPSGPVSALRLVVLDGTWRKSSKMLHLNPLLQQLPRLPLEAPPSTRYAIRKARLPHQLSTLEACCHALIAIEKNPEKYQPLLDAFDGFVTQQAGYARAAITRGGKDA